MHYIIQENVFRERHYDLIEQTLIKFNLPYTVVRIFPFVDKIVALGDIPDGPYNVDDLPEYNPPTDNVWCFGAIKLARIASLKGWKPGSMMNANHDFMVYKEHYGENLLNWNSQIINLTGTIEWKDDSETKFIRPTQDTKSFTGALFNRSKWEETLSHNLHNFKTQHFNEDTPIQVSTPKEIFQEIRCWVINGKIITASNYRIGGQTIYKRVIDQAPIEWAQLMVNKFQLAQAFVIDICETKDGWKIVECGCINCAGFYDADIQKLISEIDYQFSK